MCHTMTPKGPERLPMPLPPGGPTPAPNLTLLARLLRYRFFLVALVIILFFAALFAWQAWRGAAPSHEALAPAAPAHEGVAKSSPDSGHSLIPAPTHEAKAPEAAAHPSPAAPAP